MEALSRIRTLVSTIKFALCKINNCVRIAITKSQRFERYRLIWPIAYQVYQISLYVWTKNYLKFFTLNCCFFSGKLSRDRNTHRHIVHREFPGPKSSGSRLWFGRTTSLQQPAMFRAAGAIFVRIFCGGSACYLPLARHSFCSTYLILSNTSIAFFTIRVLRIFCFVNVVTHLDRCKFYLMGKF